MRLVIFVCGHPGAGKTTLVREFIDDCENCGIRFEAKRGSDGKGYWIQTKTADIVVFGRWSQHNERYPTRSSNSIEGRCDGGDRNQPGRSNMDCIRVLDSLPPDCIVVSDSVNGTVLNASFVRAAVEAGCTIHVCELEVARDVAFARARARDAAMHADRTAVFFHRWDVRRRAWTGGVTKHGDAFTFARRRPKACAKFVREHACLAIIRSAMAHKLRYLPDAALHAVLAEYDIDMTNAPRRKHVVDAVVRCLTTIT